MRRVSKDNQDLQSARSSSTNFTVGQQQYAKSFQVGSGTNKKFININLPNIEIKSKEFYKKQPYCTICFRNFTTTFRQHHCRLCVNAVCGDCSRSLINKQRACDICIMRFTNIQEEKKKKQMLETLETLCAYLIYQKSQKIKQLEIIKGSTGDEGLTPLEVVAKELDGQNTIINELQQQNNKLKLQYQQQDKKLKQIREANCEIQNKIQQIQKQMQEGPNMDKKFDD